MSLTSLQLEWNRLELMASQLQCIRRGQSIEKASAEQLLNLQQQITELRQNKESAWAGLRHFKLSTLAYDILACIAAIELAPHVTWMFQSLCDYNGMAHYYPHRAFLQQLLFIHGDAVCDFVHCFNADSSLMRSGLIRVEGDHAYAPIKPTTKLLNILKNTPNYFPTPPGSHRILREASWEDLIVPSDVLSQLKEYLFWIEHRKVVVDQWKGTDVGGPIALFAGPPGVGKTYAASVLAQHLNFPLFQINLGSLVSKYIGETERNINLLFDAVHGNNVILQFDEADSLFGKRREIKEARDRYANMTVSHLLARIEVHKGPVILTSNFRDQLDKAFLRRIHTVIEFSAPNASQRKIFWKKYLPLHAPLADDFDVELIAHATKLTGAEICNASLYAAYLAAGNQKSIGLSELAIAVWREISKQPYKPPLSRLGALANYLPAEYGS